MQASELYIDERQNIEVCASPDDVLEPGEHRFTTSFQLPRGLPTSLHGKHGSMAYTDSTHAALRLVYSGQLSLLPPASTAACRTC